MCYRCEGKEVRINVNVLRQLTVYALRVALAISLFLYHCLKINGFYFEYSSIYFIFLLFFFLDELLLC